MNQLSWLLYLAGLSSDLSGFFGFVAAILVFAGFISMCVAMSDHADHSTNVSAVRWFWWVLFPAFFVCALLSVALPERDTVLAIAASEMGEKLLETPMAGRVGQALEAWVNKQLEVPAK